MDPKLQAIKDKYGRAAVLRSAEGEVLFAFRPANAAHIADIQANLSKDKEASGGKAALMLIQGFCAFLLVLGTADDFKLFCETYPLKIVGAGEDGSQGLFTRIFDMAEGDATVEII